MLPFTLELVALGCVTGVLSAVLGQGGGIFIVPALTMLFGLPIRVAVAASFLGIIATSISPPPSTPSSRGGWSIV